MELDQETLLEFQSLTSYDIMQYLRDVSGFFNTDYPRIMRFFKGQEDALDSRIYKTFTLLRSELLNIINLFSANAEIFQNVRWWLMLDYLEDLRTQYNTISQMHRWSRSSITHFGPVAVMRIDYAIGQNQTLERIATDVLYKDRDYWSSIALDNNLTEEQYTPDGGVWLQLKLDNQQPNFYNIQAVVDTIVGKSIYGRDLDKRLTLSIDDEGYTDLVSLDYDQTIQQAMNILIALRRNSNPSYAENGLQSSILVGGNRATLNFPIVERQLQQVFDNDDTFKNFKLTQFTITQDVAQISYTIQTRLDEVYSESQIMNL